LSLIAVIGLFTVVLFAAVLILLVVLEILIA